MTPTDDLIERARAENDALTADNLRMGLERDEARAEIERLEGIIADLGPAFTRTTIPAKDTDE